jgi:hypothetical protein
MKFFKSKGMTKKEIESGITWATRAAACRMCRLIFRNYKN